MITWQGIKLMGNSIVKGVSLDREEEFHVQAADFLHGKPYQHTTGEIVRFVDNRWVLVPRRGEKVALNFGKLPVWLQRPAKLAIAHCWLEQGRSVSHLLSLMGAFRRLAEWLSDFRGKTLADLIPEHETLMNARLSNELRRYEDALEAASLELGSPLSFRQSKKVCREASVIGPKSISSMVYAFNLVRRLVEETDHLVVPVRLQLPRGTGESDLTREVGSA